MPELSIPLESLVYIIEKAREYDAQVPPVLPEDASNATDDDMGDPAILEDRPDNPTQQELTDAIDQLGDDQRDELVALMWLGRGDYTKDDWDDALETARERHNGKESQYLMGTPLLADYLEEGGSQLGYSREDLEDDLP